MIPIKKGKEPPELKKLRDWTIEEEYSPEQAYASLQNPLKRVVREQLVREQGHLCAYCMCEIPRTDLDPGIAPVIIEHYIPRKPANGRDLHQGLDYNNLLAVCNGNRTSQSCHHEMDLTCDAHRGNIEFRKVDPCKPETLSSIFYTLDGHIGATDPDVNFDLVNTLNLNCPSAPLIAERKAVLNGLFDQLALVPDEELLDYCLSCLDMFKHETDPKTPYVGVLLWYLNSMINSLDSE